jgi:hypothetical protein
VLQHYGMVSACFACRNSLVIAVLWMGLGLLVYAGQIASGQQDLPLRDAVECRERGGLPNVYAKLKAGKEVRIAYLGGSITEQNGWRPKTLDWYRKQFPTAHIVEINAAIGGTGSDLGVYRVRQDVLGHQPDLLFVEFAVNDSGAPVDRILKAMEGIVRQTWRAQPTTDICFVYTLTEGMLGDLEGGKFPRAASVMEQPELWKADKPGETVTLRYKGTALMVYDLLGNDGHFDAQGCR